MDVMAQINIKDSLIRDRRFRDLSIALGSEELAIGALYFAWRLAQDFWLISENGIPKSVWKKQKIRNEIISVGLAEDRGDFIYCFGSRENFQWLKSAQSAGIKSGVSRSVTGNQREKQRTKSNEHELISIPISISKKEKTKGELSTESIAPFIGSYVAAFQKRYGPDARPMLDGKAVGLAKTIVRDVGLAKAVELVQVFLQLDDPWFLKKTYDLSTFRENLNKVSLAATTGRVPDGTPESGDQWKKRMLEKLEG